MRSRIAQLFALCCVASASSSLLHAQFQAPTKEELEMTSDPKAPGADAVYLYREERTDDALHYHSEYVRIKILTEKGKELATVRTPYEHRNFKVTDIQGRTIHSDGTAIPLKAKPSDLMDVKTKDFQLNTMVFTLPNVELGSILEYRFQIRYDDDMVSSPTWDVQQPYYVHKAHYFFQPSPRLEYITNGHGDAANRLMYGVIGPKEVKIVTDATGRYTYDISDVPPFPSDDWMPPLNSIHWRVEFYYTGYTSGGEFWQKEGKRWAKETDHFAAPSKALKEAVSKIVAPADTDAQKARKIYEEVMKLDNTDFTREKSSAERKAEKLKQIKDAEDVWNQKSGSSDNIALLFVALARAAGLHAYPMQVVNRNRALFDPNFLSLSQLDDYIAAVTLDGKDVLLDPGEKMCPFGALHWKHSYASGLRLTDNGPVGATTPNVPYTASTISRVANLSIDPSGNVKGTARFIFTGQEALHWRQLALKNDEAEVKKQFIESIHADLPDGVQAEFDHFLGLDEYNSNLMAFVTVSGGLGTATGKHFFLPEQFFEAHARHPFVAQDKRTTPIDVHYPRMESDNVTYHLPSEIAVEIPPAPGAISWPDHAVLKVSADAKGNDVTVARTAAFNFTLLPAKDYGDLHDFFQKVATADQQQLVLTRSQTAKGN
jgi:transglutaminase-like putative cysteine protease